MSILGPILGAILPPLVGGIFGQQAAAPAQQASSEAARAQAEMINELMKQYREVFAPAQREAMERYLGISRGVPAEDIATFQLLSDLLPTFMPDIIRSRAEYGIRRGADRETAQLREDLARRGITGPAAEALLQRIRERETAQLAGLGSDIAAWEAEQTLAGREKAFQRAMDLLGLSAGYSGRGPTFPGQAAASASDLMQFFSQQAQQAAAPWMQVGANVAGVLGRYFQGQPTPTTSPYTPPTYSQTMKGLLPP